MVKTNTIHLRPSKIDRYGRLTTGEYLKRMIIRIMGWTPGTEIQRKIEVDFESEEVRLVFKRRGDETRP